MSSASSFTLPRNFALNAPLGINQMSDATNSSDIVKAQAVDHWASGARAVTARKDDAAAADLAAITNVAGMMPLSGGRGLIQTTYG